MEEYKLSAFEKMLLKTLFVTKGDEVTEWWRKLDNKVMHSVCFSQNVVIIIKPRVGETKENCRTYEREKMQIKFRSGYLKWRVQLGHLGVGRTGPSMKRTRKGCAVREDCIHAAQGWYHWRAFFGRSSDYSGNVKGGKFS
jgi:hypothetical protein